jgi:serine O-acetyltransferase
MEKLGVVELFRIIREDWECHASIGEGRYTPGFRAVAVHRFGVWLRDLRFRPVRAILIRFQRFMYRYIRNYYGIELHPSSIVGRRLVIGHQSGIVIRARIGNDCVVRQNVTIGGSSLKRADEIPTLGNGVHIGCGVAIVGDVTIGDNARIGPNAVVMTDVPAGATVFASAPRVVQLPQERKLG